ncbi:MAG: hypothetical protein K1Y36_30385 [Blastocatellia bacterium]|nr:hypothetical protein [Blastocatellia bacterium]
MGTDITSIVEQRIGGIWQRVEIELPDPRNHLLYAMLAGVGRCWQDIEHITTPRGLPEKVSPQTQMELDRMARIACCVSYLTYKELLEWDWQGKIYQGRAYADWASNFLPETMTKLEALQADPADVRLIFYFDNGEPNPWV